MRFLAHFSGVLLLPFLAVACGAADDPAESEEIVEIPEEEVFEASPENTGLAVSPAEMQVVLPEANARRGRILFTVKGCVICHQVNGVGGKAAPDLSAYRDTDTVKPLTFSARMWRGAGAMTQLQDIELGYTIELDDQDIADLAAFAASPAEQALFTIDAVGEEMRTWFLDERFWITGDWEEYAKRGSRIPKINSDTEE